MKHLIIRNLGPISQTDVCLERINLIIGTQGSGKSCLLKTASYCSWVEKRIEYTQNIERYENSDVFIKELVTFHRLEGYIKQDTFISYESDFMRFSYDERKFSFEWKDRWNYRRSKISYIPAERNLVSVIPNWFEVKFEKNNIQDFMADWSEARTGFEKDTSVLSLGVAYRYDKKTDSDIIDVEGNGPISLSCASSGLQSLIPLYIHLSYLLDGVAENGEKGHQKINLGRQMEMSALFEKMTGEYSNTKGLAGKSIEEIAAIRDNYVNNDHYDLFVEEPEENLFPTTQVHLTRWLIEKLNRLERNTLFISTHSPYILSTLLQDKVKFTFLCTSETPDGMVIKEVGESEKEDIYRYGVDAFFNIESLAN